MGQTLENGVYLPSEGERNCYAGLKTNWEILDQKVADVTALQQAVAGALHRQIVASLPTTDIDPNTIYMVLSGTSATENVYNEFMYVNNAWELIGTSATDLTNYYTKAEVDGKLLLKANDSDVVHKSGNETINGSKTFLSSPIIYNSDTSVDARYLALRNQKVKRGSTTETGTQFITFHDKDGGTLVSYDTNVLPSGNTQAYINVSNLDANSQRVVGGVKIIKTPTETWFIPDGNNSVSSGLSNFRWSDVQTYKVNALEPSSLSLPSDRSARIDISSYFTNTGTEDTNSYTVPANGYIYLTLSELTNVHCFSHTSGNVPDYAQTFTKLSNSTGMLYVLFPVRKGDVFKATWYTSTTVNVGGAYFIPCQGNV